MMNSALAKLEDIERGMRGKGKTTPAGVVAHAIEIASGRRIEPKSIDGQCFECGESLQYEELGADRFGFCPCSSFRVQDWKR